MGRRRRVPWAFLLFLCACLPGHGEKAHAAQATLEYAIKANFLYKFAPFVEWPAGAFPAPDSPVMICVQGADTVSTIIDQAESGQRARARAFVVRHLDSVTSSSGCHVLYAAGSPRQSAADAIAAVKTLPVLTVSDTARTGRPLGMIAFVLQDNRVRFDIDVVAANEAHISISSRLLSLARSLKTKP